MFKVNVALALKEGEGLSDRNYEMIKLGTPKMALDLTTSSIVCVHFQNQLCTYLDGALIETNFDP